MVKSRVKAPVVVTLVSDHTKCGGTFTPQCFARGIIQDYDDMCSGTDRLGGIS